jgi:4-hydroxythreonine-4-phosphate dehydrogenase
MIKLALTMGDPTGVGPELIVKALAHKPVLEQVRLIIIGDLGLLCEAAERFAPPRVRKALDLAPAIHRLPSARSLKNSPLAVLSLTHLNPEEIRPGRPGPSEGRAMYAYIEAAVTLALKGTVDAVVTGPINKKAMLAGGSPFGGHTELLASLSGAGPVVMMLVNPGLRVAMVTTHIPVAKVPKSLSKEKILSTIIVVHEGLINNFGIKQPRLVIAALNPHAGEGGTLGQEERRIIAPALVRAKNKGILIKGPLPADTLFTRAVLQNADAVICMYHDQALIPLKMLDFEKTVNITLGLPFVRTSVGHGTAPDIAWKGIASETSLLEALKTAREMIRTRKRRARRTRRT